MVLGPVQEQLDRLVVEAPAGQGAATKSYFWYFEELQRSPAGWIGGQTDELFLNGALGRIRASVCGALVLSFLVAMPSRAGADDEEARRYFQRAQTAYRLGKYEEAVKDYEAAYKAMPVADFLFNIAQAQRMQYGIDKKSWRLHKALALYRSYLREARAAPNRDMVVKIVDELKQVLADVERRSQDQDKPGELVLRGTAGAQVSLDGERVGKLPVRRTVDPGVHVIRVEREGYAPWESTVRISAGGQLDVPISLERLDSERPLTRPRAEQEAPFYRKWWFWTIAGAVVVAGAGTGIYFATQGDNAAALTTIDLRN